MLLRISLASRLPWRTPVACLRRYATNQPQGLNQSIKGILNNELEKEENHPEPNRYKLKAFNRALSAINKVEHPIQSLSELKSIKGIGRGISKRISDILVDSALNLSSVVQDECEKARIRDELMTLPTIGLTKATKLAEAGCKGIKDMNNEKYISLLNRKQRTYLKYLKNLTEPALHEEAKLVANFIRGRLPGWEVLIVGDLRRRVPESTEIQILLVHKEPGHLPIPTGPLSDIDPNTKPKPFPRYVSRAEKRSSPLHKTALPALQNGGFLAEELDLGPRTWEGIVRLPRNSDTTEGASLQLSETFSKLVLIAAPVKSRGAALIAWTGDPEFFRSMRVRAHKFGMYLNEVGLWKWHVEDKGDPEQDGESYRERGFWQLLQSSTEEEIFEQLDMETLEPERRNFMFISDS